MRDGLAGHEHDFYKYVAHSSWLGQGTEYSNLNEGFSYWFNGLVPLAYGINDARLKAQVHRSAQAVLDRQAKDGWLGPESGSARNFWARYPFFLGLTQLAVANSTWTAPIVSSLHRFNELMHSMLADNYTGYIYHDADIMSSDGYSWGQVRGQDMMISLQWLYEHHPGNQSSKLLDNMKDLHDKRLNWEDWYNEPAYFGRGFDKDLNTLNDNLTADNYPFEHGVNVGQGLKAIAVVRRFTHDDSLIKTAMDGVNWTMTYHGASHGSVIADERLVGLAPYSGSELCTSVEIMYSLSYLYQALGSNYYADRAELTAFNSLPSMLTPNWWAHQYMESPNQPYATNLTESLFYNTNSWGSTYGLEPNYPCCTVNHPQGYPEFLSNSFVKVVANGLAQVKDGCTTAYPFMDTLAYKVTAKAPLDFYVRVPAWAGNASKISIDSGAPKSLSPHPETGLHKLSIPKGTTNIHYMRENPIRTEVRENDTVAVYKGALLYALRISHTNTSTIPKPYSAPATYMPPSYAPSHSRDWQYHSTSAWNYAIDPSTLVYHGVCRQAAGYELANPIFSPGAPPGYITAQACEIDWPLAFGSVPGYPPTGDAKKCLGNAMEVRLVPFASGKTYMSELPVINLGI